MLIVEIDGKGCPHALVLMADDVFEEAMLQVGRYGAPHSDDGFAQCATELLWGLLSWPIHSYLPIDVKTARDEDRLAAIQGSEPFGL
jgi:hypothetical protein